jgi:adenylosuccinate lyase
MERTLDDSANRRLALPESFLALDGTLDVLNNVVDGLIVHEATVAKNLQQEMPFLATERLMMEAVAAGADRQDAHEIVRTHAVAVARRIKEEGAENDLLAKLAQEPMFASLDLTTVADPSGFIGRAPSQVDQFNESVVAEIKQKYAAHETESIELRV